MTMLADRSIAVLRTNYDDLAARARVFDDADLAVMSGAREWTVGQVLSHLGSGSEIMRAGVEAANTGNPPPADDFNQSVWARWDAMSPREQADGYVESAGLLMATLESLDEAARADLRVPMGFLPEPADLALVSGLRLVEAALHSWDVRVAFDAAAGLYDDEAEVMLAQLTGPLSFLLGFSAQPDRVVAASAALRVETTTPTRSLQLTLAPAASLSDSSDGSDAADGVLAGPAEALLRALTGRYDTARTTEALTVHSDTVTIDQLKQVFPGY